MERGRVKAREKKSESMNIYLITHWERQRKGKEREVEKKQDSLAL